MHTPKYRQYQWVKLGAMLTLGAGVALFLQNVYLWFLFHVHIPVQDQAHILPLMQAVVENGFSSIGVSDWIAPVSGAHRIAVTRLLMSIDYLFLDGQNYLIYLSTWASIVALLGVMLSAFKEDHASEKALVPFVAGITLAFLSSRSQVWNVVNPINSSWYITFAASALSFACITSRPAPPGAWRFLAAYAMATIAAFSTFSGVLVWLILPLFIAIRSTAAGVIAVVISALSVTLYLSGISTDQQHLSDSLQTDALVNHLPREPIFDFDQLLHLINAVLQNTLVFLGSPLSITNPRLALLVVITSIAFLAISWSSLLKSWFIGRANHHPWTQLNLAIATLCLGTATAANLGRVILATPSADRYQTIVMMYWLSICGLILGFGLRRSEGKPLGQLSCMALCITVSLLFLVNPSFPITTAARLAEAANRASALDILGVSGRYLYLSAWRGDYLNEFHTFFANNKLAHRARDDRKLPLPDSSTACTNVQLNLTPTKWPGILLVSASIEAFWVNWNRQIPVSTAQGTVIGTLYPVFGDRKAKTVPFLPKKTRWRGYLDSAITPNQRVYLHYRSFTSVGSSCGVSIDRTTAFEQG